VAALVAGALCLALRTQIIREHRGHQVIGITLRLATLRTSLEKEVIGNLLRIQGAATFIAVTPHLDHETFERYAATALRGAPLLRNLAAAPDFVITYVYPLEGNRQAVGLDYRTRPEQWEQALLAMERGELVVAGPIPLVQGGTGLVGRAPVLVRHGNTDRFWGLVSSVMDIERLYEAVGLRTYTDLQIAIRGLDGKGEHGATFFGDPALFDPAREAVFATVAFPAGSWQLAALPVAGWTATPHFLPILYGLTLLLYAGALILVHRGLVKDRELGRIRDNLTEAQGIAHLGSWEMHFNTGTLWWSDETYRIFGLDRSHFTPTLETAFALFHPDDMEQARSEFLAAREAGEPYSVTHRIVRPDGTVRHIFSRGKNELGPDGRPARSMGTLLDITPLKETEAALRTQEQKLRAMSDTSLDGIVMVDAEDTVLFWNNAATRLFGYGENEAMGRTLHELISLPADSRAAQRGYPHFARTGTGPVIGSVHEFTARRKDNTTFPVERSVSSFQMDGKWYAVGILRDITKKLEARRKLESYARRIALASDAGGVGVWEWDIASNKLTWDDRMHALYAVKPGEFSGLYQAWTSRVHPDDLTEAERSLNTLLTQGGDWNHEFRILLPEGGSRHIRAAARAHKNDSGTVVSIIGINQDITEQRLAEQELIRLATHDSLTGLFSRGHFMELGARAVEHARRYGEPLAVIMFDADRFKAVNDTHGHDIGDMVLKAIGRASARTLREVDVLGRIGGEEFAAVLPQATREQAILAAERLRAEIAASRIEVDAETVLSVTVSLGVCATDTAEGADTASLDELLKGADTALYKAKQNGRDRVESA
jgi:diguanylate cyclase (GGDEF)-like protein/PAS domain S-box-containing protein